MDMLSRDGKCDRWFSTCKQGRAYQFFGSRTLGNMMKALYPLFREVCVCTEFGLEFWVFHFPQGLSFCPMLTLY